MNPSYSFTIRPFADYVDLFRFSSEETKVVPIFSEDCEKICQLLGINVKNPENYVWGLGRQGTYFSNYRGKHEALEELFS